MNDEQMDGMSTHFKELQETLLLKDQETMGDAISHLQICLDTMEDLTAQFSASMWQPSSHNAYLEDQMQMIFAHLQYICWESKRATRNSIWNVSQG